jgi:hypothetical protein
MHPALRSTSVLNNQMQAVQAWRPLADSAPYGLGCHRFHPGVFSGFQDANAGSKPRQGTFELMDF